MIFSIPFVGWLPPVYQHISFWHTFGLFVLLSILKGIFYPRFYTPSFPDFGKKKKAD